MAGKAAATSGASKWLGPLAGLAARAVLVLDENNTVLYAERVAEITEEPNYGDAQAVLG